MNLKIKKKFVLIFLITFGLITTISWTQLFEIVPDTPINEQLLMPSQTEISSITIISDNWATYDGEPWFHLGDGTENDPHRIENVTVNPNFTGTAIYVSGSSEFFIIQNCTMVNAKLDYNMFAGILLSYTYNGIIRNNTIYNSYRGISCNDGQNINITDNVIFNCTENGIRIDYSLDIEISNNEIYKTEVYGLYIRFDCSNIRVIGNTIHNNTGGGFGVAIMITGGSSYINHDNYVYNNTLRDNVYGILISSYTNRTEVMYNKISNSLLTGMEIRNYCFDNYVVLNNFSNTHNALDYTSNNYWDNGTIGNLYDDYISSQGGYDLDDDGIGDIPYKIYNNWAETINTVNDTCPICDDGDDIPPIITINNPINDTLCSSPPTITISIYDVGEIDSQWYEMLNTSEIGIFSGMEFQIEPTLWNNQSEGLILIRVFVNDTGGNNDFSDLQIIKDSIAPTVDIINPTDGMLFSEAPELQVAIFDIHINETWYTIVGTGQNYPFSTSSFELDSTLWGTQDDGTVIIRVYANDTVGNIGYADLTVVKDTLNPSLTLNSPLGGAQFGNTPPTISLTIIESHLDKLWFTINDSTTVYFVSAIAGENIFAIESSIWDAVPEGHVLITFFANDTLGNLGTISLTIIKEISEGPTEPPGIPGFDIIILLLISTISIAYCLRTLMVKKKNHR